MPYLRGDPAAFDEILSEIGAEDLPPDFADKRPTGEFEYQAAKTSFKPAKLGKIAKLVHQALLEMGATAFRVRYDGGFDEGFAYSDHLMFGKEKRPVESVAKELASSALAAKVRALAAKRYYKDAVGAKLIKEALDELAHEMACQLLGESYGTGEYQLYGAFTADLKTGKITDDPKAGKPRKMR
jgi:hypothetical protein